MSRLFRKTKAQSTAEYAIMISIVIAAVIGMQIYMRRGLQGKVKDVSDAFIGRAERITSTGVEADTDLDDLIDTENPLYQYEPYYVQSVNRINRDSAEREGVSATGTWSRVVDASTPNETERAAGSWQGYTAPEAQ